ncbi:magnesium/cobalt transporter CorA [Hymenobacter sp. BT683]|uniref:Magnesium transport protein CorA n=1 Tax=Hymenobacter jeongseonensis TaxID=2791027 RepID=A0ABS0IGZ0_9BACT|nr:magnesium/cobalt transporter CorA [Hymenobacter jeongseonensis]MBF9237629.1 magnesium/cobalt transporter CorA [Hymenobacter jeongseonensis]
MTPTNTAPKPAPIIDMDLDQDGDDGHGSAYGITDREATLQARHQTETLGQRPGSLIIREGALKPRLFLYSYDDTTFIEAEYPRYDDLWAAFRARPELKHWIDVRGYGDLSLMERLMEDFDLHPLQMEDVLGDYQRAKVDVFGDNRLFLVSRMTDFTSELEIDDDQLSVFTGPNYVITFQDDYEDCLDSLRNRLRGNFSTTKRRPSLYLAYALTDVVIDHYFPTMAAIGDYLEGLEDRIFSERRERRMLNRILRIKKDIVRFRRLVYPERDKISEILRLPDEVMPEEIKVYFKDAYDHSMQALDLAESYRENITSLTELFLSDQSNRMNEVMKVLTIISAIFIPLSFVAGVYGMNFQRESPPQGPNPLNMPELYQPWGYPAVLSLMGLMVIGQLYYFWRKGWLSKQR